MRQQITALREFVADAEPRLYEAGQQRIGPTLRRAGVEDAEQAFAPPEQSF
jgi:hypothetical protein